MIVGLIDDYNEINIYIRLFAQFFSAAIIIYFFQIKNNALDVNLYTQTPYIIIFISIILSVWLMNLFNFMDGIDGYTAYTECICFVCLHLLLLILIFRKFSFYYFIRPWFFKFRFFIEKLVSCKNFYGRYWKCFNWVYYCIFYIL